MKLKKLLLLSSLTVSALGVLASCGGDDKTHVVFWHTMGDQNEKSLNVFIKAFEEANPNIKIDASSQGGYADLKNKIDSAISGGTTPTMSYCYPDHVADYARLGAVCELSSFVSDPEIGFKEEDGYHLDTDGITKLIGADDYVEGYWSEGKAYQTPGLFSVPYSKSTEAIYYNKDFFDSNHLTVPTTWAEMWNVCQQIVDIWTNNGIDPVSQGKYALGYDSDSNLFITLCEQMGIPYTTNQNITVAKDHLQFNNPQAKNLVTTLKGYYDNHYLITKNSMDENAYTSSLFTEEKVIMSIGSTGGTSYNDSNNFEVGVAPIPVVDTNNKKAISQGPSICFFSRATSAEQQAAWKFYKFITSTENTTRFAIEGTGYDPVRISAFKSSQYQSYLRKTNIFSKAANVSSSMANWFFYSPVFCGSAKAREEVGNIVGLVLHGDKTVDQAFTDSYNLCVQALK